MDSTALPGWPVVVIPMYTAHFTKVQTRWWLGYMITSCMTSRTRGTGFAGLLQQIDNRKHWLYGGFCHPE